MVDAQHLVQPMVSHLASHRKPSRLASDKTLKAYERIGVKAEDTDEEALRKAEPLLIQRAETYARMGMQSTTRWLELARLPQCCYFAANRVASTLSRSSVGGRVEPRGGGRRDARHRRCWTCRAGICSARRGAAPPARP